MRSNASFGPDEPHKRASVRLRPTTWTVSKGDPGIERTTDDPVEHIEEYLATYGLEKDRIGIVVRPRLNDNLLAIKLEVNIRVLEEDDKAVDAIDSIYSYDPVPVTQFIDEVYPAIIDKFEDVFIDARLQYYQS